MSAYGTARDTEETNRFNATIDDFVSRNYSFRPSGGHQTIILFPGGLGSQLKRAKTSFQTGGPFNYYTSWLDCNIALGEATNLQMVGDEDFNDQFVIPDGAVELALLEPYKGFADWCRLNDIDLFVFGWDWRRSIADTVDFFLNTFVPALKGAISSRSNGPPPRYALVGHSFGGMVVKMIMNDASNAFVQNLQCAITVASPFYGYGGHIHRFFKGDPDLNWTEGAQGASAVTRITSTLPAGYELLFMEKATYDSNAAAFQADPEGFDLPVYPCLDEATGQPADPYNPVPSDGAVDQNGLVRFVDGCGFQWPLLHNARTIVGQVSQPLPSAVASKLFCIRGVQTSFGAVTNQTVVSQIWKLVPPTFDPDQDSDPVTDAFGPGDGTQPAWTTRLLGLTAGQVITVRSDSIEHMTMMDHPAVQQAIGDLLELPIVVPSLLSVADTALQALASRIEMNSFLEEARRISQRPDLSREARQKRMEAFLRDRPRELLQALLARGYMDALKSPSQKLGGVRGR